MLVAPEVIAGLRCVAHPVVGVGGLEVQPRVGTVLRVVLRRGDRALRRRRDVDPAAPAADGHLHVLRRRAEPVDPLPHHLPLEVVGAGGGGRDDREVEGHARAVTDGLREVDAAVPRAVVDLAEPVQVRRRPDVRPRVRHRHGDLVGAAGDHRRGHGLADESRAVGGRLESEESGEGRRVRHLRAEQWC